MYLLPLFRRLSHRFRESYLYRLLLHPRLLCLFLQARLARH